MSDNNRPIGQSNTRVQTERTAIARGCEVGLFVRSGTGTKTDAFR